MNDPVTVCKVCSNCDSATTLIRESKPSEAAMALAMMPHLYNCLTRSQLRQAINAIFK